MWACVWASCGLVLLSALLALAGEYCGGAPIQVSGIFGCWVSATEMSSVSVFETRTTSKYRGSAANAVLALHLSCVLTLALCGLCDLDAVPGLTYWGATAPLAAVWFGLVLYALTRPSLRGCTSWAKRLLMCWLVLSLYIVGTSWLQASHDPAGAPPPLAPLWVALLPLFCAEFLGVLGTLLCALWLERPQDALAGLLFFGALLAAQFLATARIDSGHPVAVSSICVALGIAAGVYLAEWLRLVWRDAVRVRHLHNNLATSLRVATLARDSAQHNVHVVGNALKDHSAALLGPPAPNHPTYSSAAP